jgi:hypothetical protein
LNLTLKERDLLLGVLIMDEAIEEQLKHAPATDSVQFSLDDLLSLYGWLNAPGNQSKDEDVQQRLDRICDRVQRLIPVDMFED